MDEVQLCLRCRAAVAAVPGDAGTRNRLDMSVRPELPDAVAPGLRPDDSAVRRGEDAAGLVDRGLPALAPVSGVRLGAGSDQCPRRGRSAGASPRANNDQRQQHGRQKREAHYALASPQSRQLTHHRTVLALPEGFNTVQPIGEVRPPSKTRIGHVPPVLSARRVPESHAFVGSTPSPRPFGRGAALGNHRGGF